MPTRTANTTRTHRCILRLAHGGQHIFIRSKSATLLGDCTAVFRAKQQNNRGRESLSPQHNGQFGNKLIDVGIKKHKGITMIELLECGCCGQYHPTILKPDPLQRMKHRLIPDDCRNDANRYTGAEDYAEREHVDLAQIVEIPLVEAAQ